MRATLLFVLSAVLIWFVWHSLDKGDDVSAADTVPGALLAPETSGGSSPVAPPANALVPGADAQSAAASTSVESAARATPPPAVAAPAKLAVEQPASEPARNVASSATIPVPTAPSNATARSSEAELAGALVSDPAGFLGVLERSATPTGARRTWAVALGQALNGNLSPARDTLERLASEPEVKSGERECLARLVDRNTVRVASASAVADSPLTRAAYLVAQARAAEEARAAQKHRAAIADYSEILLAYVNAPWKSDPAVLRRWTDALLDSQRFHRWNRAGEWPSVSVQVKEGDSLIALRKRVLAEHKDLLLCTGQIQQANEMRGSTLRPGQTLRIPTDRARMLVDLDAHWAFYMLGDEVALAWEVGVGKPGSETAVGQFVVGDKREEPMWFRKGQAPVPYGDPANQLGTRWIGWNTPNGESSSLGFHGTNAPESIGKNESDGCVRMRNADVERLFEVLPVGAEIRVQP